MGVETKKYSLYSFFIRYFKSKDEDEKDIPEWLHSQFKYKDGKLQISTDGDKL